MTRRASPMPPYSNFGSVPELVRDRAVNDSERVAVRYDGAPCTFGELDAKAAAVQAWLADRGTQPGHRVAILMRNSLEFLYVWLGIARSGAVGVPLNTAATGEALAHPIVHSGAVGVFTDDDLVAQLTDIGADLGALWQVTTSALADVLCTPAAAMPVTLSGSDPMNIIYTSVTTGPPKGVVLSHTSYLNTGGYFAHHLGLHRDDVLHTCLPLFHCNAQQTTVMAGLVLGCEVALNGGSRCAGSAPGWPRAGRR